MRKSVFGKLMLVALLFLSLNSFSQQKKVIKKYFPVSTEKKEWRSFESHNQMTRALNLQPKLLSEITSDELIEIYLSYPLLIDIWAYEDIQTGFDHVKLQFNGLQVLMERKDLPDQLISKYKSLFNTRKINKRSAYFLQILALQDEVIKNSSDKQKNELVKLTSNYLQHQLRRQRTYALNDIAISALVLAKASDLEKSKAFADDEVQYFLRNGNTPSTEVLINVLRQTTQIDTDIKILETQTVYVKTPNNSSVKATQHDSEPMSWWQRYIAKRDVKKYYPNATVLADASGKYNCHSYAWYYSSSSNDKWINAYLYSSCSGENLHKYWTDGSYVTSSNHVGGTKISYGTCGSSDHSGVWYGTSKVRSKWGSLPLMEHDLSYCPYSSGNTTDYKRYVPPSLSVSISGPVKGTNSGTYTWTAYASGGTASSYLWKYGYDGINYNGTFGSTQSVTAQLPLDRDLFLKCTVTATNGLTGVGYHHTLNLDAMKTGGVEKSVMKVFPNPTTDRIQITLDEHTDEFSGYEVRIYDSYRNLVHQSNIESGSFSINTTTFRSGNYYVVLVNNGEIIESKNLIIAGD